MDDLGLQAAREIRDSSGIQPLGSAPSVVDPGIDAAQSVINEKRVRLRSSLYEAVSKDPDVVAEANRIAGTVNLPRSVVFRNLPEVKQQAKIDELAGLRNTSPILANMMENEGFASLAHDDAPALGKVEGAMRKLGGFKDAAKYVMGVTEAETRARENSVEHTGIYTAPDGKQYFRGDDLGNNLTMSLNTLANAWHGLVAADMEANAQAFESTGRSDGSSRKTQAESMSAYQRNAEENAALSSLARESTKAFYATLGTDQSAIEKLSASAGAFASDPLGVGLDVTVQSAAPMIAMMAAAALTRVAWGGTGSIMAAGGGTSAAIETGNRYAEKITSGMAHEQAWTEATVEGGIVGAFDAASLGSAGRAVGTIARASLGGKLATGLKEIGKQAALGAGGEANAAWSSGNAAEPAAMMAEAIGEVFGAIPGGLIAAPRAVGEAHGRVMERVAEAEQARETAANLSELHTVAQESKTQGRDREAFQAFAAELAQNGRVSDLYIDPKDFVEYFQSRGIDPAQVAETMPSVRDQFDESMATQAPLRIPLAEYTAHLATDAANDGLIPFMRVTDNGMHAAEAEQLIAEYEQIMQQEAASALDDVQAQERNEAQVQTVRDRLAEQLTASGRVTPQVAQDSAKLAGEFYRTVGAKLGMTPEQFADTFALNVTGAQMDAEGGVQFEQGSQSLEDVRGAWADSGIDFDLSERGDVVTVSKIVVPESLRERGVGTRAMEQLAAWADANGKHLALSPSSDFGGNKKRLTEFYKRFGFKENKGKSRVFSVSESMVRESDKGSTLYQGGANNAKQFADTEQAYGGRAAFDKAKADGKTKMNYNQWVQVRTPEFKAWFGDWEATRGFARINAFVPMNLDTQPALADKKAVEEAFRAFAPSVNKNDGREVVFPVGMAGKIVRHRGFDVKRIAGAFDKLFAEAVPMYSMAEEAREGHKRHPEIASYHEYVSTFAQDGVPYYVRFTVQEMRSKSGRVGRNFSHSSFVTSMDIYAKSATPDSASFRVIDPVFAEGVAPLDKKLAQWIESGNPESVSKVIDQDTGEPMVVYHGTGADVSEFRIGGHAGAGAREGGLGVWLTNDPDVASGFSNFATRGYYNPGGNVLPLFANIKSPWTPGGYAEIQGLVDDHTEFKRAPYRMQGDSVNLSQAIDTLRNDGHDGIALLNTMTDAVGGKTIDQFVALDPAQVKSATGNTGAFSPSNPNILMQGAEDARGFIRFDPAGITNAPSLIALLEKADNSTFLHELGHYFFEVYNHLATLPDTPADVKADMAALVAFAGVESVEAWQAMTPEARREGHEKVADAFEQYLFEGKAPSLELHGVFQKFRAWLVGVYKALTGKGAVLTDEVRGVFDRMLADDAAIAQAQSVRAYLPMFESAEQAGMTADEFIAYQEANKEAEDRAIEALDARSLREMQWLSRARSRVLKKMQAEHDAKRAEVRGLVLERVLAMPIYQAMRLLKMPPTALRQKKGDPKTVDPSVDSMFTAIAKLGGLNKEQVVSQWGIDPKDRLNSGVFGMPVLRAKDGGMMLDDMALRLYEYGYLPYNENDQYDLADFESRFFDELGGKRVLSSHADMAREYADYYAPEDFVDGIEPLNTEADFKFDAALLRSQYGEAPDAAWRSLPRGRYGMISRNGNAPDVIAEHLGFMNGEELIAKLIEARPIGDVVDEQVDAEMLMRYGEMPDAAALERAADEAIHNEARRRFVAMEEKALAEAVGSKPVLKQAAEMFAAAALARKTVAEAQKHGVYAVAEGKAAKAAHKARIAGELQAAAMHKRTELLNGYMVAAAIDFREELSKSLAYLKKLDKASVRKNLGGAALVEIDELLSRFDLRASVTNKAIAERASLREAVETMAKEAGAIVPDLDPRFADTDLRKHYSELTVEEFRALLETVKQLEVLARRERTMYKAVKKQTFQEEKQAVLEELRIANPEAFDADGNPVDREAVYIESLGDKLGKMQEGARGSLLGMEPLIQWLTRGKFGSLHASLFQRLSDASDAKRTLASKYALMLKPYFDAYSVKERYAFVNDTYRITGVANPMNRMAMLSVILNYGNLDGRQRLRDGNKMGDAQVKEMMAHLTEKDFELANAVWVMFDEHVWPDLHDLNMRTTGQSPPKVMPAPFETPFGTARGGYYPIVYDSELSERAHALDNDAEVQTLMRGGMSQIATQQGSSKTRVKEVKRALSLNLMAMDTKLNDTLHDIAFREAVADTLRVVNDKAMQSAIKTIGGTAVYRTMKNRIAEVAARPRDPTIWTDKVLAGLRRNTLVAAMGLSIRTALLNFTGLAPAASRVGVVQLAKHVAQFNTTQMKSLHDDVLARSEYMTHRVNSFERDLQNQFQKYSVGLQGRLGMGAILPDYATWFILLAAMDKWTTIPTWRAAYENAKTGKVPELGMLPSDEEAVKYADHIIRETHGSGRLIDLADIQGGQNKELLKLITMFWSYFGRQLGLLMRAGRVNLDGTLAGRMRFVSAYSMIVILPSVLGALLTGACHGDDLAKCLAREVFLFNAGFIPIVRDLARPIWATFDSDTVNYGYKLTPAQSAVDGILKLPGALFDTAQGDFDKGTAKDLVMGIGFALGLPVYQAWRTIDHVENVMSGESEFNPWYALMGEPKDR